MVLFGVVQDIPQCFCRQRIIATCRPHLLTMGFPSDPDRSDWFSDIYNGLPRPVQLLIHKEKEAMYEELTALVIAIDITELKKMVADFTCNEETACLAHETPDSPTKAICKALTATHLQTPQIWYNPQLPAPYTTNAPAPAQVNPFVGQGGCGNLFGPIHGANLPSLCGIGPGALGIGHGAIQPNLTQGSSLHDRPIRLCYQDMNQLKLPHHHNTATGHTAYQLQVMAWHIANPNSRPNKQHPYPLLPGGFTIGSCECWDCGLQGHLQGTTVCQDALLPEPEHDWHCITGYITHMYNKEAHQQQTPSCQSCQLCAVHSLPQLWPIWAVL